MRAAVFHGERDLRIEDVQEPGALRPTEIELRPLMSGVCGTDLHEYRDGPTFISATPHVLTGGALPQILGHELSGEVMRIGDDVRGVRVGERVSVMPLVTCGECAACRGGLEPLCAQMACLGMHHPWGGFAERLVIEEGQAIVMPDEVSDAQGALVEPAAVAVHAVDRAGVRAGDTVLVTGAGPIGSLTALHAHMAGLEVIVSEPNPARAAFARGLGVGPVVNPAEEGAADLVSELTGGRGPDAAIECSGAAAATNFCIAVTAPRGTVVQTGVPGGVVPTDLLGVFFRELSVVGSLCYDVHDWPRILRMFAQGRFPAERIVTARVGLDDLVEAGFEPLLDPAGSEVKVLVDRL